VTHPHPNESTAAGTEPPTRRRALSGHEDELAFNRARTSPDFSNNSVRRVANLFRSALHLGMFERGTKLDEPKLIKGFSASRTTMRAVLGLFDDEGSITRVRRAGTHVNDDIEIFSLDPFRPSVGYSAGITRVVTTSDIIPAPPIVARLLGCQSGEQVYLEEMSFFHAGDPDALAVGEMYVLLDDGEVPDIDPSVPLLERLTALGVTPSKSETTVRAALTDARTSRTLGLPLGAPILWRQMIVRDPAGRVVVLGFDCCRTSKVSLSVISDYDDARDQRPS
jgi:DNA-binding GntR family transcriptional regulator